MMFQLSLMLADIAEIAAKDGFGRKVTNEALMSNDQRAMSFI